jgi:hypothetical protein
VYATDLHVCSVSMVAGKRAYRGCVALLTFLSLTLSVTVGALVRSK